jgi:hypothetical protein
MIPLGLATLPTICGTAPSVRFGSDDETSLSRTRDPQEIDFLQRV